MRRAIGALALLLGAAGASAADDAATLAWLSGDWVHEAGARMTEEIWMPPRGGMLLGMSRESRGGKVTLFEVARILPGLDGRLSFVAQPGGGASTSFQATELTPASVTFENRAHDYPQRIRYWREGEALWAEISLADGTRARRWRYQRR